MIEMKLAALVSVRFERLPSCRRRLLSAPGRLERRRKLLELRCWHLEDHRLRAELEKLYGRSRWASRLIEEILSEKRAVRSFDSEDHSVG